MLTRHVNELSLRLERVFDIGCAEISGDELRRWYGQTRLSKTVWRDIKERWEEIDAGGKLLVGISQDVYVFVYGTGVKLTASDPDGAWLNDFEDWL